MALYIKLKTGNILEREKLERKMKFAESFLSLLKKYFTPSSLEIWYDAPSKELHGFLKQEEVYPTTDLPKIAHKIEDVNCIRAIIKINGTFRIALSNNDVMESFACLSINNKTFEEVYRTLEFEIYKNDVEDVFLLSETFRNDVHTALQQLTSIKGVIVEKCVIGETPDSFFDVRERVMVYYASPDSLLEDFIKTLDFEMREEGKTSLERVLKHVSLFQRKKVAKKMWGLMESRVNRMMPSRNIKSYGGSMTLIASEKKSFEEVYQRIRDNLLIPVLHELPDEDEIEGRIKKALGKIRPFEDTTNL